MHDLDNTNMRKIDKMMVIDPILGLLLVILPPDENTDPCKMSQNVDHTYI